MVLTVSFRDHVKTKIESDPEFRQALFQEAVQTLLAGDADTARTVLRTILLRPSDLQHWPKRRGYRRKA